MDKIPKQTPELTQQLVIVHLSDLHFGPKHRFNPPRTAGGDEPDEKAFPSLLDKLRQDLDEPDPGCPVVVCISGDFVETGDVEEFQRAEEFLEGMASSRILGKERGKESVFIVPGNHDVTYQSGDMGVRWQQWTDFYNRFYGKNIRRETPHDFVGLFDRTKELGALLLCLNSAIHVEKGKPDEDRGRLDVQQLTSIEESLEGFDQAKMESAVRVALLHHHPVLIPPLCEPGKGYDAVHNSGKLLTILRRYGFHLVLHGHKHNPHTFTDNAQSAQQDLPDQPIFIAAGGSVASCSLPPFPRAANCYNRITVKWHPRGRQARVRVETRGLRIFDKDGTERLPTRWSWASMRVDDRHFFGGDHMPSPGVQQERKYEPSVDEKWDKQRTGVYEHTRGNLPVVQVRPSLVPGQAYEAVLWIVPHPYGSPKPDSAIPTEVTWSAGMKFDVVTVRRDQDPNYAASLTYWGPMLVQARMRFPDGYETAAYVYARMPTLYHAEGAGISGLPHSADGKPTQ